MSKELLEAFTVMKYGAVGYIPEEYEEACSIVESYLTPPSADDVCKALSEDIGKHVIYNKKHGFHYMIGERVFWIVEQYNDKHTITCYLLPKNITLIGRFYEQEAKK